MRIKVLKNTIMNNEPLTIQLNAPGEKFRTVPIGESFEVADQIGFSLLGDNRYKNCLAQDNGEAKSLKSYANKSADVV